LEVFDSLACGLEPITHHLQESGRQLVADGGISLEERPHQGAPVA
jgi:hypothetical protein